MSDENLQAKKKAAPQTGQELHDEALLEAPDGWTFRFLNATKPELLRLMASGAFRDALRASLCQDECSPEPRAHGPNS